MDFTREPIIETIITPKEGCKLVIRSSKSAGQEEYFVDAVEIVAFGNAFFFRSLEKPKAFLVPVSDYEVLEVREARMVLKNVGIDRSIKIAGGREGTLKASREQEKGEILVAEEEVEAGVEQEEAQPVLTTEALTEERPEIRVDKKRDRRRHYRKRRGREELAKEEAAEPSLPPLEDEKINIPPPGPMIEGEQEAGSALSSNLFSSLLQPPPTLISETINRYRQNELFKGAFYLTEEEQYKPHDKVKDLLNEDDEESTPILQEPTFVEEAASGLEEESAIETSMEKINEAMETAEDEDETSHEYIESQEFLDDSEHFREPSLPFSINEEKEEEEFQAVLPLYAEEERVENEEEEESLEEEREESEENVEKEEKEKKRDPLTDEPLKKNHSTPQDDLGA